jgi:hypothetical protein
MFFPHFPHLPHLPFVSENFRKDTENAENFPKVKNMTKKSNSKNKSEDLTALKRRRDWVFQRDPFSIISKQKK